MGLLGILTGGGDSSSLRQSIPPCQRALPAQGKPGDVLSLKPRGREEGGHGGGRGGAPQLESYSEACLREAGGLWGICRKFYQMCLK